MLTQAGLTQAAGSIHRFPRNFLVQGQWWQNLRILHQIISHIKRATYQEKLPLVNRPGRKGQSTLRTRLYLGSARWFSLANQTDDGEQGRKQPSDGHSLIRYRRRDWLIKHSANTWVPQKVCSQKVTYFYWCTNRMEAFVVMEEVHRYSLQTKSTLNHFLAFHFTN